MYLKLIIKERIVLVQTSIICSFCKKVQCDNLVHLQAQDVALVNEISSKAMSPVIL